MRKGLSVNKTGFRSGTLPERSATCKVQQLALPEGVRTGTLALTTNDSIRCANACNRIQVVISRLSLPSR